MPSQFSDGESAVGATVLVLARAVTIYERWLYFCYTENILYILGRKDKRIAINEQGFK